MRDLRVVHIIREVPTNTNGLCALSSNDDSPYLAYPKSSVTGEIQIFDTIKLVMTKLFRIEIIIFMFSRKMLL